MVQTKSGNYFYYARDNTTQCRERTSDREFIRDLFLIVFSIP